MHGLQLTQSGMIAMAVTLASLYACAQRSAQDISVTPPPESALSIRQAQLLQPEALNRVLQTTRDGKPLVLQIGSHVLFAAAHVPGAECTGPAGLKSRVASLPRTKFIVLYRGCCTWNRCCNVAPAFKRLLSMGFTNVKVLYLADSFAAHWVERDYRIEQGH